jgi:dUTP pyrophosphatase
MEKLQVEVINRSPYTLPAYQTLGSAGLDLQAYIPEDWLLKAGEYRLIPTGLFMALPLGYEAQVRPRSGLAFKHGITVLNSPGTIDSDYRGEVGVLLINHGKNDFTIKPGERIAQLVVCKHDQITWQAVEKLSDTDRGAGGFGSTGR